MITKVLNNNMNVLKRKHNKEIMSGAVYGILIKIFAFLINYLLIWYIAQRYGASQMGIFNLIITFLNIFTILSMLGTGNGSIRYISNYKKQSSNVELIYFVKKILFLGFIGTLSITTLLVFFNVPIAVTFFDGNVSLVYIICFTLPFYVFNRYTTFIYRGLKKVSTSLMFESVYFRVLVLIILLLLSIVNFGIINYEVAASVIISAILVSIVSFIYLYKDSFFSKKTNNYKTLNNYSPSSKDILNISLPMMISSATHLMLFWTDTLMLGAFLGPEEVGIYNVALRISLLTSFFLIAINNIIAPKISELYWNSEYQNLKEIIQFSSKILFVSSTPVLVIIILFSGFFLNIFGSEYTSGKYVLIVLCFSQLINSVTGFNYQLLNMTGSQSLVQKVLIAVLCLNVILNVFLILIFGMIGAAIATSLTSIIRDLTLTYHSNKKLGYRIYYLPFSRRE
ncbi:flippase [Pontibacillus yanchengensis]|uniref:Uncharacterized protein n=1 Tax=Pontibacillus yanchengensis Y32 TaxID=1385514 RepID=A0A0A2TJQ4_9BACI|nr:flippase [Pontibacillus yanchengensis]KGP74673.1 hypothetical protein N782_00320 [Pontibacillus yanchengensis Y32]